VVKFNNELALQQSGGSLYKAEVDNQPVDVEFPGVAQGALESSNVQPIIEMTRMIEVHRKYEGIKSFIDREDERQKTMIREMLKSA